MKPLADIPGDIANTAAAQAFRGKPLVSDEDRELHLALQNSLRRNVWRMKAGLPLRPAQRDVDTWRAFITYRFWLARYRRRHPHFPITPSAA